jgi:hypothetical protein
MTIRLLLAIALLASGIMAYSFEAFSKGFVILTPYGAYEYMQDIQGSMSDGGIAFGFVGVIFFIIGCALLFIKNTKYVMRLGASVFLFLLLALLMIEGDSIDQLIINTIKYDQNIYLTLWCVLFITYTILFILLSIKRKN